MSNFEVKFSLSDKEEWPEKEPENEWIEEMLEDADN